MLDFIKIRKNVPFRGKKLEIYPDFLTNIRSKDLMIKGHSFYAIWDEENNRWSTNELDVQRLVDKEVYEYANTLGGETEVDLKLLENYSSGKWGAWTRFCRDHPDSYKELDTSIIFANQDVKKTDYASKSLNYPLKKCKTPAYDEMMNVLYKPEEREKIEWAIGAIISGDSKKLQKFIVLYGGPGTGKSTVLNIIQMLFDGYYSTFDSKALGNRNSEFALEPFKNNPLIAIEHDGDLSKIDDNTRLNSIVSHEELVVNEKRKTMYTTRFHTFIFMGTNKPVRITDSKSGIIRRLIDVSPTGNTIKQKRYNELMEQITFELPGIASHCLDVYQKLGPKYYSGYMPLSMMAKTNDMYNFISDNYIFFEKESEEGITLATAWLRYKDYCNDALISYPLTKRVFKDELKDYFNIYRERWNGTTNWYQGFKTEKFEFNEGKEKKHEEVEKESDETWLKFNKRVSLFDDMFQDCPAQYGNEDEKPNYKWSNVKTTLGDLDTKKLHYAKLPTNIINIDFDLKDESGNKSLELNMAAASKWPPTYAELSKSGVGIHLCYIYDGDVNDLGYLFDTDIEIKKSVGNSSLRRKLTKCNDLPIATINSGLPLKEKKVITEDGIKNERHLRNLIKKGLRKEIFPNTKPSVDYIYKVLDDAYKSGMKYDVMDMAPDIQQFALSSSHQADTCMKLVSKMHFQSDEPSENVEQVDDRPIIFFDIEVFPNLFIVCWKKQGSDKVVRMINPKAHEIEELCKMKLVGFNNRRYDNHILYAAMMGYTNEQLFKLSTRIVNDKDKNAMFGEAYNLSYTDVYDFLSANNKMGLKKWEIQLGIHHVENGHPWDQPLDEKYWKEVADYCCNDVRATEAVWDANQADWKAREILAKIAELTVNDTTNSLTTKIIVGNDRNPQQHYIYTDLSTIFPGYEFSTTGIDKSRYNEGTKIVSGKSIYKGKDPGEGGYAIGNPGIYYKVALLDVESMHPHSAMRLKIFGEEYTLRFAEIVEARLAIKHKDFDHAKKMLGGKLAEYLDDPDQAKALANALKTAINSVYGLTSAKFSNKLKDPRNKDNIVAKYGALFMINLEEEVKKKGFTVVHIKTDSIKIADATPDIISFCMDYAKEYGYTFKHEATYEKMCIVNDSVYIAKYAMKDWCEKAYGYIPDDIYDHEGQWTATGKQFQVPYVFKTLFSHEKIVFKDLCEVFSTQTALYLDMNEKLGEDEHDYRFIGSIGEFCPVLPGTGGGVLLRSQDDKYNAVAGTKKPGKIPKGEIDVYYWMESETVKLLGLEDKIDKSYYNALVNDAIETISQFGDFEQFSA